MRGERAPDGEVEAVLGLAGQHHLGGIEDGAGSAACRHPREVERAAGGEQVEDGRSVEPPGDLAVGDVDGAERDARRELGEDCRQVAPSASELR